LLVLGEVTKLVIEYNRALVTLGLWNSADPRPFTNEVVVKHNAGTLNLYNDVGAVEIQANAEKDAYGLI